MTEHRNDVTRSEIAAAMEEYLSRGGKINKIKLRNHKNNNGESDKSNDTIPLIDSSETDSETFLRIIKNNQSFDQY